MTRRALLIGSETYGLTGCDADVELMEEVLRGRRFDRVTTLTGSAATRAGIITALQRLVAEIEPADAVVVYYSGHGGRVPRPDAEQRMAAGSTTHFHFLVPFDIDSSAPGDFRGLLSEEMTVLQRRMTDAFLARGAVPNVTTILDCCHSGYFARAADAWQKSVDLGEKSLRLHGIREHAQRLGAAASVEAGATNPHAVRLVACQPEQSAYELTTGGGGRHGAMTDAFASILGSLGDHPVSWAVLADLVRRRVRARLPEQRPDVEGPSALALFSTDQAAVRDALPVTVLDGRAVVECGPLLGVEVGDELRLEQLGGAEVGNATVASIDGSNAVLTVSGVDAALPADVVAVRTTTKRPRYPVAVGAGDAAALLDRHLTSSTRVRPALDGEPVLAQIEHGDGGLVVRDSLGARWRVKPLTADELGVRRTVDTVEEIAAGRRLLDLSSGVGPSALDAEVQIQLGIVRNSRLQVLDRHGAELAVGDLISLVIRNRSTEQLFAWVFDVGVSGRAALLTNSSRSGRLLGPAGSADTTVSVWPSGEPLVWPGDVPTDARREETFVIVLADRRGDLSSLATTTATRGNDDRFEVASLLQGTQAMTRSAAPEAARPLRYRIEEASFFLNPP